MTADSSIINYPHPVLTPIIGRPTNGTVQLLQAELYANARSVLSDLGGGANGHLAVIQNAVDYLARARVPFIIPTHPGIQPAVRDGASASIIHEVQRTHKVAVDNFKLYQSVRTALVQQIIAAVETTYLSALYDVDFGYSDVDPREMLTHLKTQYAILTIKEIEENRAKLSEPWDVTSPIESLWKNIAEIQRVAVSVNQPISDDAVLALTLPMIRRTGVFGTAITAWEQRLRTEQTFVAFKQLFTQANTTRIGNLTTSDVKYADANAATAPKNNNPLNNLSTCVFINGKELYYCWSHGLSVKSEHTSETCLHPKEGHVRTATIFNRHGGVNTFNIGVRGRGNGRTDNRTTTTMPNGN
jgi:hypothetical protein